MSSVPIEIDNLIAKQIGDTNRIDVLDVEEQLKFLGISLSSEFGCFFKKYCITYFDSNISDEELVDIICPTNRIEANTTFVREVWELPEEYICLTNCQGEGCYLYNRNDGAVYDFELSQRDEFLNGDKDKIAHTFYGFLEWYLNA